MNKLFRFVLLSSAFAMLGVSGCDSDAGSEKVSSGDSCTDGCNPDDRKCDGNAVYACEKAEDAENACYDWVLKEKCEKGKTCDETKFECVTAECSDTCDEEELYRCSLKGLLKCTPDANGCASWVVADPCEGKTCSPELLECVDEDIELCPNACDPEKESKKCDGADLYVCQKSDEIEGCYSWAHETACDNGQHCDETTFECVEGCVEVCDDARPNRCSGNELEQCTSDESGCASWTVIDACDGGTCDPETLKCVKPCEDECTADEKKCEAGGVAACISGDDGCMKWGEPEACGENETCDPDTAQCSEVCNSNCTEKDKVETKVASQRVCTDVDGKGCLQWVETKCGKGEKFDAEQNKCVSVCGDDCAPFTIVFLPDTQYYTRNIKKDSKGNFVRTDGTVKIFPDQLQYVRDYRTSNNMKAVIHLGDVTDSNAKIAWQYADYIYKNKIDDLNMPYTIAPGNHDYKQCEYAASKISGKSANDLGVGKCKGSNGSTYSRSTYFSSSGKFNNSRAKVKDRSWFKGYSNVGNSYITFKAAGIDFLVVALEYAPRKSVIEWADGIISSHPNHKVIVETHSYLSPKGYNYCRNTPEMNEAGQFIHSYSGVDNDALKGFNNDAVTGEYMFNNLVAKHNNIILVVNGHVSGSCFRLNKGNHGNVFAEMAVDYQSENGLAGVCIPDGSSGKVSKRENGGAGSGWFRMLKFDPKNYTITSVTTSSLAGSRFKKKKEWFYCKDYYPQDRHQRPKDKDGNEYRININNDDQRFTNHHTFVVDFDFVTPVDYINP